MVRDGLRTLRDVFIERVRRGPLPRLLLHGDGGRRLQRVLAGRELVRARRARLLHLQRLRGGRVSLRGVRSRKRHGVHELHGGQVLGAAEFNNLRNLPDNSRRLRVAQRHRPGDVRLQ